MRNQSLRPSKNVSLSGPEREIRAVRSELWKGPWTMQGIWGCSAICAEGIWHDLTFVKGPPGCTHQHSCTMMGLLLGSPIHSFSHSNLNQIFQRLQRQKVKIEQHRNCICDENGTHMQRSVGILRSLKFPMGLPEPITAAQKEAARGTAVISLLFCYFSTNLVLKGKWWHQRAVWAWVCEPP